MHTLSGIRTVLTDPEAGRNQRVLLGSIGTRLKNDGMPIPELSTTSLELIQFGLGVERR